MSLASDQHSRIRNAMRDVAQETIRLMRAQERLAAAIEAARADGMTEDVIGRAVQAAAQGRPDLRDVIERWVAATSTNHKREE